MGVQRVAMHHANPRMLPLGFVIHHTLQTDQCIAATCTTPLRATVRSYLPQLRDCFERLNGALPSASVNMRFIIARDGEANDGHTLDKSEPAADSVAFAQLAQCVDDVRRTMQFPAPDNGIVSVDYPVSFEDTPSSSDH
jgi:hypothetical protein